MESTVEFINDVGSTVKGTVSTLLKSNYVLGETIVALLKLLWKSLVDCAITLCQLIVILLEDLAVFLAEIGETIVFAVELFYAGIDSLVSGIHHGTFKIVTTLTNVFNAICASVTWCVSTIFEVSNAFGRAVSLAVNNLIYGVVRIPVLVVMTIYEVTKSVLESIGHAGRTSYEAILDAPVEAFVGFITGTALLYLTISTSKRIIRERQITAADVLRWSFKVICFIYCFLINFLIGIVKNFVRLLEFTLSHLHVPRFHHAGDSDQEDDDGTVPPEVIDDDNEEEEARIEARRRNYDLLIKRRNERQRRSKSKSKNNTKANKAAEDVEELLLEQVEREREDKLCVICQDQEKCIM